MTYETLPDSETGKRSLCRPLLCSGIIPGLSLFPTIGRGRTINVDHSSHHRTEGELSTLCTLPPPRQEGELSTLCTFSTIGQRENYQHCAHSPPSGRRRISPLCTFPPSAGGETHHCTHCYTPRGTPGWYTHCYTPQRGPEVGINLPLCHPEGVLRWV